MKRKTVKIKSLKLKQRRKPLKKQRKKIRKQVKIKHVNHLDF